MVLLSFKFAYLLGISSVLFLEVPAAAHDPINDGWIHPQDIPGASLSLQALQVKASGYSFRETLGSWVSIASLLECVPVFISLIVLSIYIVTLWGHICQHPSQCWLTQGLCKLLASLSRDFCQTYDRQLFWEESYFRKQLAIHQASGICLILSVGWKYAISGLWLCFPIAHCIAFLIHIPQSNLISGDIIILQPHLKITIPVWLNNFQQSTETCPWIIKGPVESLNHNKAELPWVLRAPRVDLSPAPKWTTEVQRGQLACHRSFSK